MVHVVLAQELLYDVIVHVTVLRVLFEPQVLIEDVALAPHPPAELVHSEVAVYKGGLRHHVNVYTDLEISTVLFDRALIVAVQNGMPTICVLREPLIYVAVDLHPRGVFEDAVLNYVIHDLLMADVLVLGLLGEGLKVGAFVFPYLVLYVFMYADRYKLQQIYGIAQSLMIPFQSILLLLLAIHIRNLF